MTSVNTQPHVLDNPAWHALSGRQSEFAIKGEVALRYFPQVFLMGAIPDEAEASFRDLTKIVERDEFIALIGPKIVEDEKNWSELMSVEAHQMTIDTMPPLETCVAIELTISDVPEMLKLISLARPGPFDERTIEMGKYVGVRKDHKLVAMAGERIKLNGYTEVSAICTHPEYRRRDFAKTLTSLLVKEILERGDLPFLHVVTQNTSAIKLYEKLGFKTRRKISITAYKRL